MIHLNVGPSILPGSGVSLIPVNQSEISIVVCQPIRDQYCCVPTNQRSVLHCVNQSEESIHLLTRGQYHQDWSTTASSPEQETLQETWDQHHHLDTVVWHETMEIREWSDGGQTTPLSPSVTKQFHLNVKGRGYTLGISIFQKVCWKSWIIIHFGLFFASSTCCIQELRVLFLSACWLLPSPSQTSYQALQTNDW